MLRSQLPLWGAWDSEVEHWNSTMWSFGLHCSSHADVLGLEHSSDRQSCVFLVLGETVERTSSECYITGLVGL